MLLESSRVLLLVQLLVNTLPELLRSEWHVNMRHTERVGHRSSHSRCRPNRASLTDAFHSERVEGRQRHGVIQFERRELFGHGHGIVHEGRGQELPILVVDDLLPQGLPNALRNPTMQLALNQQGIDLSSTVIHRDKACELGLPSLFVYLNHAYMRAEGEEASLRFKEGGCLQARLNARR